MTKKTRTVVFQRDEDGWWVATVKGLAGVHTQGRTVAQARDRIHDALAAAGEDRNAELVERFDLSQELLDQVDAAKTKKERADRTQEEAQAAMRSAAIALSHRGVSTRDAGFFLNLSHQRVHQLLRSARGSARGWLQGERAKRRK
jgi:predicted RNase H-like HicB family nuclease